MDNATQANGNIATHLGLKKRVGNACSLAYQAQRTEVMPLIAEKIGSKRIQISTLSAYSRQNF